MITILALAAALQAAPPSAPPHPYAECLRAAVDRLEPSGEPAEVVVQAAFTSCRDEEITPRPGSQLAALSPDGQAQVLRTMHDLLTEDLVLRVTRVRACRNTAGCDVNQVPR